MTLRAGLVFIVGIVFFSCFSFASFRTETAQVLGKDGTPLSGVLTIPSEKPIVKAVLILQGSGNVGADGDVSGVFLGHGHRGQAAKLSEQIATALAEKGIASLRYAKRGVEDPKLLPQQAFPYLVDDASMALGLLTRKFPAAKRAILGFSEGGLVATILASIEKIETPLFLLAPATRPIDELLAYQFLTWPIELIRHRGDTNFDGVLSGQELTQAPGFKLPFLAPGFSGLEPLALDTDKDGSLALATEVVPSYQSLLTLIQQVVKTPDFAPWYNSLKALAPFAEYASASLSKDVYVYQGMNDAQMNWSFVAADVLAFGARLKSTRLYPALGHCFSPMEGTLGEVKTSGPFEAELLENLSSDVSAELERSN